MHPHSNCWTQAGLRSQRRATLPLHISLQGRKVGHPMTNTPAGCFPTDAPGGDEDHHDLKARYAIVLLTSTPPLTPPAVDHNLRLPLPNLSPPRPGHYLTSVAPPPKVLHPNHPRPQPRRVSPHLVLLLRPILPQEPPTSKRQRLVGTTMLWRRRQS